MLMFVKIGKLILLADLFGLIWESHQNTKLRHCPKKGRVSTNSSKGRGECRVNHLNTECQNYYCEFFVFIQISVSENL